eukprot:Skav229342  [mRNA]  locus=scaffold2596:309131:310621:- [translate_table: standard]
MVNQGVFEEITIEQATEEEKQNIIGSRWVHREKGDEVRSRIVGLGYDENIKDADDIYASTPLFSILRVILCLAIVRGWSVRVGDISTAFLHAALNATGILLRPPSEFYQNKNILWRLKKAMYGLRSSPKAWQDHLASVLQRLGYIRLISEPNVFKHPDGIAYIMCYVDDLLFVGEQQEINKIFESIQQELLLRPTGEASPGHPISFLGRKIIHRGDSFDIQLEPAYIDNILRETEMTKCNSANTPGTSSMKANIDDDELLSKEEHQSYRRIVGKLQCIRIGKNHSQSLDINIFVDSDWAGCASTRKSTSGFIIQFCGTTIHFGSRTQSVVALSSAEAEFYAIGTGCQEALFIRNFIKEAFGYHKFNIRIHTDSSAGKSMASRQGVSKKAKHIELKFMFIQNLVQAGIVSIHKIPGKDNPSDILTKYITLEVLNWLLPNTGIRAINH